MKKPEIENLKAQMRGVNLSTYQRGLALDEYYKLLDYVKELEQALSLGGVVAMLPTQQKCMDYARGNFGFDSISLYQEDAFLSGCDYMREELERKIKGN